MVSRFSQAASKKSMTFPLAKPCSKFGGKITHNSAGVPSPAEARLTRLKYVLTGVLGFGGAAELLVDDTSGSGWLLRKWCKPTATECAQIVLDQLERELQRYMDRRTILSLVFRPEQLTAPEVAVRELTAGEAAILPVLRDLASKASAADVHLVRLELRFYHSPLGQTRIS